MNQAGVDILGVLVAVDEEGGAEEVAALDPQRRAAGGERKLLHRVEVHMQQPQLLRLLRGDEDEMGGGQVQRANLVSRIFQA